MRARQKVANVVLYMIRRKKTSLLDIFYMFGSIYTINQMYCNLFASTKVSIDVDVIHFRRIYKVSTLITVSVSAPLMLCPSL